LINDLKNYQKQERDVEKFVAFILCDRIRDSR